MSFNFGNTSTPVLGNTSTPAKPFGFAFGTPAATTTSVPPAFGSNVNTFATPTAPGFGQPSSSSFSFGSIASTTQTPTFGGFGTTTTQATPFGAFGSGAPTTSAPSFGFGSTPAAQAFGATSQTTSSFNFGGAVAVTSAPAPSFGFGTSTTSQAQAPSIFGNTGFGGFGTSSGFSNFGQSAIQLQQTTTTALSVDELFSQAIFNVSIYGDERDTVIARWNYLQALFGSGKALYSQSQQPVDITPQNYLCRFKVMSYSRLPGKDNKLGLVAIKFNKPVAQLKEQELITKFSQLFGSKTNLIVHIDSIKSISEISSLVIIYIEEKITNSTDIKRIVATETSNFLNQPHLKYQLSPLGIDEVYPMIPPDDDQLKQYLDVSPKGVDSRMWRQAINDNPNPKHFIPVPLVCFNDLKSRLACQESETSNHMNYLSKLEKDINELKLRHTNTSSKITEQRRKLAELSHRILRIIVKQESTRKAGLALTPEEEIIKTKLENMHALVSAPTQFKGKLNELLAQMRMQRSQWAGSGANEYTLDKESSDEMKNFLSMQQKAIQLLIETINKDLKDLKIISSGIVH